MKNNQNELSSGNDSINVQGRDNVTLNQTNNYGVSAGEARQIAMDVFKANFFDLSQEAHSVSLQRAEELSDKLITKLKSEHVALLEEIKNPDLQYVLFEAQKTFARKGNKHVGDILLEILVERMKTTDENLLQLTLNEAITVMSKLTKKQIDLLTLIFNSFYLRPAVFNSKSNVEEYLNNNFLHYYHESFTNMDFQHFNYAGVAVYDSIGEKDFNKILINNLPGIYNRGFSLDELNRIVSEDENMKKFITNHTVYEDRFMVIFNSTDSIDVLQIPERTKGKLKTLIRNNVINENELFSFVGKFNSKLVTVFDYIRSREIKNTNLTSIGIIIAITNLRLNGITYPYGTWIK